MTAAIAPTIDTMFWEWNGHRIHYVRSGEDHSQRPPLLLIHGFGASTDHWRKTIAGLEGQFEVWAIDLLGFGRSAKPNLTYSGALWRDQIYTFIAEKIGRPTVLAGNSLGGYASLCVAASHPEWVAGVVLLNSAGPFSDPTATSPPQATLRSALASTVQQVLLQPVPSWLLFQYVRQRKLIRRTLAKVYVDQSAVTDQLVEEIYRPSCDPGAAQVFAAVFKSPRGESVDVLLQQLRCPLLLLWGEGDPWMNVRQRSSQFRQHYDRIEEYFLNAGHCPHDEVPDQVNRLIQDWIVATVMPE